MTTGAQVLWNNNQLEESSATDTSEESSSANNALHQFSDITQKFIDSYGHLEQHIDRLSSELATQTAEKEQQFQERTKLAERLEGILSTLPSAVVVLDGHGRIQEFNALAVNMLGTPLKSETWLNIISRAFAPRSDDGHEISLKDGRRVKVETKGLGKEPGQIILLTDLTDTRLLQETQSRQQRLSVIGKMMASLAHQIRTPLASALLYSGQISSQKLDAEQQQRFHKNLQHSLKQLERQVSDMLLFASGGVSSKERFQLRDLLAGINLDLTNNLVSSNNEVQFKSELTAEDIDSITLFGNMQSLLGAMANLSANSIHACRNNRANDKSVNIIISVAKETSDSVTFSISDNGCGIPETHKGQIFKPFFTSRARGTGLGLAVVKTVINSFKGSISFDSKTEEGTTLSLSIPCVDSRNSATEQHMSERIV